MVIVPAREGIRLLAYRDAGYGIPTICYGETKNVKMGDRATPEECKQRLIPRLEEFNAGVESCVHVPLSDPRRAALVSFAYNLGVGTLCRSEITKRLNEGRPNPCEPILHYVYSNKKVLKGLVERRREEYNLCLQD